MYYLYLNYVIVYITISVKFLFILLLEQINLKYSDLTLWI